MKKQLSLLLVALMTLAIPQNVKAYDFSAIAPTGQTLYYNIVNGNAQVTNEIGDYPYYSTFPTGALVIPATVSDGSTTYSVTSIGKSAFEDCNGLTSVTIPNSVITIDTSAFVQCSSLTSVTIPNSVTSLGESVFWGCTGLTSVTIPNSVTSIGYGTFAGCSGLTSITIPNSVTSIGSSAFSSCRGLTSITIPNSVTSIGSSAFSFCSGLTSITIPYSVTSIGEWAFSYVKHIEYHGNATGAPWGAISMNGIIDGDFIFSNTARDTLVCYIGTGGEVAIPNTVIAIGDYAFNDCNGLTSVTIPNLVISIGSHAFDNCSSLNSVIIPSSVTSIGEWAFAECSSLTSVTIPNSVISIGDYSFSWCSSLTSVIIPNSVVSIGDNTFIYCSGVTSVTIGNSVTSIGEWAFAGCTGLTSVTIPNSVTNLGKGVFSNCSGLTSVIVGDSVTSLGNHAFINCSSLTSVNIPNSVTTIGTRAFYNCSSLTSINIPNSVTSIGEFAFYGCIRLTSVTIPNSVTIIDNYTFSGCTGLTSVTIPNSVTSIGVRAFNFCIDLTSVTIPNSVTSIGDYAFLECRSLTTLIISNSVTSIGEEAFRLCNFLTEIHSLASVPPTLGENVFSGISTNSIFYVPCGSTAAYQAANGWSNLTNYQEEFVYIVSADSSVHGMVDIALGTCDNPTATLTAVPNTGFFFDRWSDGDTTNPRLITVTSDTVLTALFVDSIAVTDFIYADAERTMLKKYIGNRDTVVIPSTVVTIMDSAFRNRSDIISVIIPNGVTSVGNYAFMYCSSLISVSIPNTVTTIGWAAFRGCEGLNSITIPNSVTSIRGFVFMNCSGLTSVTIPISVASIEVCAFYGCSSLTSVTIPSSVTTIGGQAFSGCSGLTSVTIPSSVTSIDGNIFTGCNGLIDVSVESGNSHYDSRENCNAIIETASNTLVAGCQNTVFPNTVTSIGDLAFDGCSGLTSVIIPNSVTLIGSHAFQGCSGLTSVIIPNSISSIGNQIFYGCSGLTSVSIPESVTSIGAHSFENCSGLTSVTIPNLVTNIGECAFLGCSGLTEIHSLASAPPTLGNIVFNIYDYFSTNIPVYVPCGSTAVYQAADGWSSFTNYQEEYDYNVSTDSSEHGSVIIEQPTCNNHTATLTAIPNTGFLFDRWSDGDTTNPRLITVTSDTVLTALFVDSIAVTDFIYADAERTMLKKYIGTRDTVVIPSTVVTIMDSAFYNRSDLMAVTIPQGVISIGSRCFMRCSSLTSLIIPDSVNYIGNLAFWGCSSLTTINIPEGVTSINSQTFYYCSSLTSITIPEGVTAIHGASFDHCSSLTSLSIPANVSLIEFQAFAGCSNLETIVVSAENPYFDSRDNCNAIIHTNDNRLVQGCKNTIIPNTVTILGYSSFEGCSGLSSILIPESVTYIDDQAFAACTGLTSITVLSTMPPLLGGYDGVHVFRFVNNSIPVYIPCGSLAAYQAAEGWNDFTNIQEQFDYTASAGESQHGSVDIVQATCANPSATYTATAEYGYHFTAWNDGDTNNPRMVLMTQDTFFTASFDKNSYGITVLSANTVMGNATSSATLPLYLDSVTLTATPNYGYHFTQWSDGNMDNPRMVTVTRDSVFIAQFDFNQYSVTLGVDEAIHGSVSGAGSYNYLSSRTIEATANYGYHFTTWSDGDISNPRTIILTQDTAFTALFSKNEYVLSVETANSTMGSVAGGDTAEYLDTLTLTATANYGYHFTQWSDGNMDNPRMVTATRDSVFTAQFDYNQYTVTLGVDEAIHGNVSGAGSYNYLSSRTVEASANYGYHFTAWSDGDISNPRTFTLTQDTAFTALFAKNEYVLSVVTANNTMGSVAGGDTAEYLDTLTLTATANYGYHFTQWSDGNMDNPRMVTVTRDSVFTAQFDFNQYSVTLGVNESIHGSVSGAGSYNYLSSRTIEATANYGYHFTAWSDGDLSNPRTFTLTQDTAFTALFAKNEYVLSVVTANNTMGSVAGGDTAEYLDTLTLTATANYGYHFTQWSDGNMDNPRMVTVTRDSVFTAQFDFNQYSVTLSVDEAIHGSVSGAGSYNYLSSRTIAATANYGYHFTAWSDGDLSNPRNFTLTQDTAFTALFAKNEYVLSVETANSTMGSVAGGDTAEYLDTLILTAIANYGYHFTQWNDGNMDNPRTVVVTRDSTFTAMFAENPYEVIVTSNDTVMGTVGKMPATHVYLDTVTLTATPNYGYHFTAWSDGVTDNPRTFILTQDTIFIALFDRNEYTLTLTVNDAALGTVDGAGNYLYLDTALLTATCTAEHYHFVQWSDGVTDNPRQYIVTEDDTLTAIFDIDTFHVAVESDNADYGYVEGDGDFTYGAEAVATATAYDGYRFVSWSDGSTDNPYTFVVTQDTILVATFAEENPEGIEDVDAGNISVYVLGGHIHVTLDGQPVSEFRVYDVTGRAIHTDGTSALPDGVYLIKVGNYPARRVVVMK